MCKHSKNEVTTLEKRQRGLDARGNDPMATKRESSWAVQLVSGQSEEDQTLVLGHVRRLVDAYKDHPAAKRLDTAIKALPDPCTSIQVTEMLLDRNAGFKELMDYVGGQVGATNPTLKDQGRNQPFFLDRGRKEMPRTRAGSFSNPHGGITTGRDRSDSTSDIFSAPLQHAKGALIGDQNSVTYQKFQESGAPFIGGASGTLQLVIMELETQKKRKDLSPEELAEREKLLALNSARLVAGGHHSMAECLLAAKAYGYFPNVPDPLGDYDASMKALETHLTKLGLGAGDKPLSRDSETEGKNPKAVRYQDRRAAVRAQYDRYSDQLPRKEKFAIDQLLGQAARFARASKYDQALGKLDAAETKIQAQVALIVAAARGSNKIMTSSDLVARMGKAPKKGKKASVEYKAAQTALDDYSKVWKELQGRKLDHDMAALGFEELTAALNRAKKGATDYIAKHATKGKKAGRRNTMQDMVDRIDAELRLLTKVQQNFMGSPQAGDLTIAQAIEFARHNVDVGTQAKPGLLREERIDPGESDEHFGSGAVNSVKKLVYKASGTDAKETRIFKPEPESQKLPGFVQVTGIDPNNPRFGKRNIASGKVCQRLGLGNLIPPADFATYKGQVGLAMKMAPGKSLVKKIEVEIDDPTGYIGIPVALHARDTGDPNWEAQLPKGVTHRDGHFYKEEARGRALPYESPPAAAAVVAQVQKATASLQVLDALCGQVDRHPENYLMDVDTNGVVTLTGIDNDFSFGANFKNPDNPMGSGNFFGMPPLIDRALYTTLHTMDWATFSAGLDAELSAEELDAARQRFDWVKNKVEELATDGRVVDNWETFSKGGQSAKDILMDDTDGSNNYYKRDVKAQRSYQAKGQIVA